MNPRLDRYGEELEDDVDPTPDATPRTPEEIRAHCAELRAVLAEARARREAQP